MKCTIALTALLVCGIVQGQTLAAPSSGCVPKPEELNAAQQKAVEDYVHQKERPTGELRVIAARHTVVNNSEALRTLFPRLRFVAIWWVTEADPAAMNKYSIPGPISETLVLDADGRNCMPRRTGYWEEFADLLRAQHIKIDSKSAAMVRSALMAVYTTGMSSEDRHITGSRGENSQWLLGYNEWPFRAISSYEEVREASYYRLFVDANGLVVNGRLVIEELERRKLNKDAPKDR